MSWACPGALLQEATGIQQLRNTGSTALRLLSASTRSSLKAAAASAYCVLLVACVPVLDVCMVGGGAAGVHARAPRGQGLCLCPRAGPPPHAPPCLELTHRLQLPSGPHHLLATSQCAPSHIICDIMLPTPPAPTPPPVVPGDAVLHRAVAEHKDGHLAGGFPELPAAGAARGCVWVACMASSEQ